MQAELKHALDLCEAEVLAFTVPLEQVGAVPTIGVKSLRGLCCLAEAGSKGATAARAPATSVRFAAVQRT